MVGAQSVRQLGFAKEQWADVFKEVSNNKSGKGKSRALVISEGIPRSSAAVLTPLLRGKSKGSQKQTMAGHLLVGWLYVKPS